MKGDERVSQAVEIAAAYVTHNSLPAAELPGLIRTIHAALIDLGQEAVPNEARTVKATPAQIRRSITPEVLVSFEDGRPYKTLRRHLTTRGLTPESYCAKWGLPSDYPMVATSYSEQRSALARAIGLGQPGAFAPSAGAESAASVERGRHKRATT